MPALQQPLESALFLPASAAQQQFWFSDQLKRGDPSLNIAVRFGLSGNLNFNALRKAIHEIVRRHEVLRASFKLVDGAIQQVVQPESSALDLALPLSDLSLYAGLEQIAEADRWADIVARQPFQLNQGPLLRTRLLRLARTEHVLLLTVHHIVADGWSIGVFSEELGELYEAFANGHKPSLPELSIQYADFASWQNQSASSPSAQLAESETYWQQQLKGAIPFEVTPDLPRAVDVATGADASPGRIVSRVLPRTLTDQLALISRGNGSSLFMIMLAGLTALLHRYTGRTDIAIGTQVAGRDHVEVERLIGCFVNTLALRLQANGDLPFSALLAQAREVVTAALVHGDVSFARVAELVGGKRSADSGGLLRVNFIHQRDFVQPWTKAGLRMYAIPSRSPGAIFDLNFFAVERADGWRLSCEFNKSLFRQSTVERMLAHLENAFVAVLSNPNKSLGELDFISNAERQQILFDWNRTEFAYPRHLRIQDLLQSAAESRPNGTAATCGRQSVLYSELDHKSNQLARYLHERGAQPGAVVGICTSRSIDMFVALLAILKAGAAYIPLDPSLPADRLAYLCEDAGISLLITERATANLIDTPVERVVIDAERVVVGSQSGIAFDGGATADDVAYVLYTSGSTGQPKGVEVRHRSVVNLLYALQEHLMVGPADVLLATTTLSFDIAALELFGPLLTGSQLVIATNTEAADPLALRDLLVRSKATVYQATPVRYRLLIDAGWKNTPRLKMLCGGEKMTRELADALLLRGGELWNVYGPTETTVWSSVDQILPDREPISIGRPIANTTFYILDAQLRPAAIGTEGELCIGGDGLAKGYRNRPDLTAERFIANPFAPGRIYRTGDRARYRGDGRVELLGRNDDQVKIRGFRIELGEVEAALQKCPAVSAAAVVVRQDAAGETVLAAYYTPREKQISDVAAVRAFLTKQLPPYMVPTFLIPLDRLPTTPNGKLDRKSLPALTFQPDPVMLPKEPLKNEPPKGKDRPATTHHHPQDELESALIRIWQSVLHATHVNLDDNFFELGGHSILAAKMFVRIEEELGQTLPLATLFQSPTVRELAALIRNTNWTPSWSSLVPIRPAGTRHPLFLIHPIGGNVLTFSGFCGHFPSDQPIYGLQARGLDGKQAPHTSIYEMAEDYITQIRAVQPSGPYAIGGFSAGAIVAFEMARQLEQQSQTVRTLALMDAQIDTPLAKNDDAVATALTERVDRWTRTIRSNLRYATRMSPSDFVQRKTQNIKARLAVRSWQNQRGESNAVTLTPEQGFLAALRSYVPQPYRGGAILFRAKDEVAHCPDPNLGWDKFVHGGLQVREVSGDHDTLMQEPHIGMLARILASILAETDKD